MARVLVRKRRRVVDVVREELPLLALAEAVVRSSRRADEAATRTFATEGGVVQARGENRRIMLDTEELVRVARRNRGLGLTAVPVMDRGSYLHTELRTASLTVTVKHLNTPSSPLATAAYRSEIAASSMTLFDGLIDVLDQERGYLVLVYSMSARNPAIPSYLALRDPSGQTEEISLMDELQQVLAPAAPITPVTIVVPERDEPVPQAPLRRRNSKAKKDA